MSTRLEWNAEALQQRLAALLPGLAVEVRAQAGSTNTLLLERAGAHHARRDDDPAVPGARRAADRLPCLLVAEEQTAGRGRLGRAWQSAAGASLTFSLALPLRAADYSGLSLAVGVALAEALDPPGPGAPRLGLKWPNDLWLLDAPGRGRKLGGILIETAALGTDRLFVIGIGLNLRAFATAGLDTGLACLQELHPGLEAPQALDLVALPLARALREFERAGFAAFAARFAARDLLRGQAVHTSLAGLPAGQACGVGPGGALLVRAPDGQLHEVASGEVSVRPRGEAAC